MGTGLIGRDSGGGFFDFEDLVEMLDFVREIG